MKNGLTVYVYVIISSIYVLFKRMDEMDLNIKKVIVESLYRL